VRLTSHDALACQEQWGADMKKMAAANV
jgi:hypothetical protein